MTALRLTAFLTTRRLTALRLMAFLTMAFLTARRTKAFLTIAFLAASGEDPSIDMMSSVIVAFSCLSYRTPCSFSLQQEPRISPFAATAT